MTEDSPYAPPTANIDRPEQKTSHAPLILLGVIAFISFLDGVGDGVLQGSQYFNIYNMATFLVYGFLAVAWYTADTHKLGRDRSTALMIALMLILIIGMPVYLFRSRGAAKGAIATFVFVLFLLACGSLSSLGEMTVIAIKMVGVT